MNALGQKKRLQYEGVNLLLIINNLFYLINSVP